MGDLTPSSIMDKNLEELLEDGISGIRQRVSEPRLNTVKRSQASKQTKLRRKQKLNTRSKQVIEVSMNSRTLENEQELFTEQSVSLEDKARQLKMSRLNEGLQEGVQGDRS